MNGTTTDSWLLGGNNTTATEACVAALDSIDDLHTENVPSFKPIDRISILWYILGFIGNPLSLFVWAQRKHRLNNSSAWYLITLSACDTMFLILHIPYELQMAWTVRALNYPVWCSIYPLLSYATQYISSLLVLGFSTERYISICHPFHRERFCTPRKSLIVCVVTVFFGILINVPQLYFWHYDYHFKFCDVREDVAGKRSVFVVYTYVTEMLVFAVVPVTNLLLNFLVTREMVRISQRTPRMSVANAGQIKREKSANRSTTLMLLCVSFFQIFTQLPATIVYALDQTMEPPWGICASEVTTNAKWNQYFIYFLIRKIIEEICMTHFALNFFIYLLTGIQFRQTFQRKVLNRFGLRLCCRGPESEENGFTTAYPGRLNGRADSEPLRRCRLGSLESQGEKEKFLVRSPTAPPPQFSRYDSEVETSGYV